MPLGAERPMTVDRVFLGSPARASDFEFNRDVAEVFDDMLARSVPYYHEQQALIEQVARKFYVPGTAVYDLGCATGVTLLNLARALGPEARVIGYDSSPAMLDKAQQKIDAAGLQDRITLRYADFNQDLSREHLSGASVVTVCWTLQFVRPLWRDRFVRWINGGMTDGSVLVCMEKVLTQSSDMNRFFVDFYYEYKSRQGYSREEIVRKREALENVLVPYRNEENVELFRRNGFATVETCFQWFNFAGYLCLKAG
jgi:tRNA (cmo5U34)-methyltransferase